MKRKKDAEALVERYHAVQALILEKARSYLIESHVQDLRCLVRLVVEFDDYLDREEMEALDPDELEYLAGSVFAGISSFVSVGHGYGILDGATHSAIAWPVIAALDSPRALKERYRALYQEFESLDVNVQFVETLGIVLDLFKMQLVFVSILYNW